LIHRFTLFVRYDIQQEYLFNTLTYHYAIIISSRHKKLIQMSSEKIFVSTLDMVDLLVPEYPESTCNYLVSEASFTRPAPRPNNDIFYFDEGPQHQ
jgi:hypothetical protein